MDLSTRMKRYEASYKFLIPPRTYTIIRVDGKNFSKFTKNMTKPFDGKFTSAMHFSAIEMCKYFNPDFAYTQSDEISLVFTDFGIEAQQAFDGKVQKLCSLSASVAATNFNKRMMMLEAMDTEHAADFILAMMEGDNIVNAQFDSRVFVIPDYREVLNYFIWRQQDASRNSVSMAAQALYSHKELQGKSGSDKQEMMFEKGVNWNDYPVKYKRGVVLVKETYEKSVQNDYVTKKGNAHSDIITTMRKRWVVDNETPIFTLDKEYLKAILPSTFISSDSE